MLKTLIKCFIHIGTCELVLIKLASSLSLLISLLSHSVLYAHQPEHVNSPQVFFVAAYDQDNMVADDKSNSHTSEVSIQLYPKQGKQYIPTEDDLGSTSAGNTPRLIFISQLAMLLRRVPMWSWDVISKSYYASPLAQYFEHNTPDDKANLQDAPTNVLPATIRRNSLRPLFTQALFDIISELTPPATSKVEIERIRERIQRELEESFAATDGNRVAFTLRRSEMRYNIRHIIVARYPEFYSELLPDTDLDTNTEYTLELIDRLLRLAQVNLELVSIEDELAQLPERMRPIFQADGRMTPRFRLLSRTGQDLSILSPLFDKPQQTRHDDPNYLIFSSPVFSTNTGELNQDTEEEQYSPTYLKGLTESERIAPWNQTLTRTIRDITSLPGGHKFQPVLIQAFPVTGDCEPSCNSGTSSQDSNLHDSNSDPVDKTTEPTTHKSSSPEQVDDLVSTKIELKTMLDNLDTIIEKNNKSNFYGQYGRCEPQGYPKDVVIVFRKNGIERYIAANGNGASKELDRCQPPLCFRMTLECVSESLGEEGLVKLRAAYSWGELLKYHLAFLKISKGILKEDDGTKEDEHLNIERFYNKYKAQIYGEEEVLREFDKYNEDVNKQLDNVGGLFVERCGVLSFVRINIMEPAEGQILTFSRNIKNLIVSIEKISDIVLLKSEYKELIRSMLKVTLKKIKHNSISPPLPCSGLCDSTEGASGEMSVIIDKELSYLPYSENEGIPEEKLRFLLRTLVAAHSKRYVSGFVLPCNPFPFPKYVQVGFKESTTCLVCTVEDAYVTSNVDEPYTPVVPELGWSSSIFQLELDTHTRELTRSQVERLSLISPAWGVMLRGHINLVNIVIPLIEKHQAKIECHKDISAYEYSRIKDFYDFHKDDVDLYADLLEDFEKANSEVIQNLDKKDEMVTEDYYCCSTKTSANKQLLAQLCNNILKLFKVTEQIIAIESKEVESPGISAGRNEYGALIDAIIKAINCVASPPSSD